MASDADNRAFILRKMLYHGYVGGKHTDIENLPRGKPTSEHGDIMRAVKELIRDGWILPKRVPYGSRTHVSINARALAEIRAFLDEWLRDSGSHAIGS